MSDPAVTDDLPPEPSGSAHVDWDLAAATGRRLVPAGPRATREEVGELVAELRRAAARAVEPVARTSRMHAPAQAPPPLIVDRPGWVEANVASMRAMLGPVLDDVLARRRAKDGERTGTSHRQVPGPAAQRIGGAITGTELAALLAWVSTKVLGQYDLAPQGTPRLLLVAPNILHVERELDVDPHDFRLWVALHEETHRVQFTAVPWLRDHIVDRARSLGRDVVPDPDQLGERVKQILTSLPGVIGGDVDITQVLATPEQRAALAEVTAVMSLLEGHADVVMDEVGPEVVPTVEQIRRRFDQRRKGAGTVDVVLRRLLGMDAKMRQYRDGAAFVRTAVEQVGWQGFNRVWESPSSLPRAVEITDPAAWVRRVHG